jgi:hypothetical protein
MSTAALVEVGGGVNMTKLGDITLGLLNGVARQVCACQRLLLGWSEVFWEHSRLV